MKDPPSTPPSHFILPDTLIFEPVLRAEERESFLCDKGEKKHEAEDGLGKETDRERRYGVFKKFRRRKRIGGRGINYRNIYEEESETTEYESRYNRII